MIIYQCLSFQVVKKKHNFYTNEFHIWAERPQTKSVVVVIVQIGNAGPRQQVAITCYRDTRRSSGR